MSDTEKTEQPTGKRLGEARQKGNVAKSPDLSSAITILVGFLLLYAMGRILYNSLKEVTAFTLANLSQKDFTSDIIVETIINYVYLSAKILLPILGGLLVVGLIVSYIQIGFLFTTQTIKPDLTKLNIVSGVKKLFNVKSFVKLLFSVAKLLIIGGIGILYIKKELAKLDNLIDIGIAQFFILTTKLTFGLVMRVSIALVILAIVDYIYQKWQYKRGMKMSKKEVKDERKQADGDPLIKSKIKSAQIQMALKRMASAIPKADVVVTNPTHYAIALKYDRKTMLAPKVVAKGADYLALKIREIAKKHKIPMVEDRSLARTLYKTVDVGKEIPQKLYYAVAKVLSYVYGLKKK
ncbi:MAG: flagellar biosynthesis protein FlhB [Candidatus Kuenenia sp.]|nr:flagellar biosynthesis protein FlhB [Candidatus Kuenenia hertensis]